MFSVIICGMTVECPFAARPVKGRNPSYPLCRRVGLSIAGAESSTGLARIPGCPVPNLTDINCQTTPEQLEAILKWQQLHKGV